MKDISQRQAVIYCRVSSIKQTKVGDGLGSQEVRCREFARMKGYQVAEVFQDDVSGGLIDRPGLKAMLTFIRKHRASGVVVIIDDVTRLARSLPVHLELRSTIAKAGGVLESPSIEFGEDSDSVLIENLLASVSQHQRQKNGEQTRNRMRARVMNGYWVFQAPMGYRYERVSGRGKMLKRDEPLASLIQKALEGYASGYFNSQADVMRFLQDNPLFPRDSRGIVRHQRVGDILTRSVYAGYVEAPEWDIPMRPGQHEPLISRETYQRIQERRNDTARAPYRKDLSVDFPLRGFVLCADCDTPLTACWSTGSQSRHPYYLCHKRGCISYGKSIRRERIEGDFEELLHRMTPTPSLLKIATRMFKDQWQRRSAQVDTQAKAIAAQLLKIEKQTGQLLDRILDAAVPSVINAYEDRIRKLEQEKLLIQEKLSNAERPPQHFDRILRTALDFLSNPWNLWNSGRLEDKQAVLKLTFADRLRYSRDKGFRTANFTLPFKVLEDISMGKSEMARPKGFEPLTPRFVV